MIGKLRVWVRIILLFAIYYFCICSTVKAQPGNKNKYGLYIIDHIKNFRETVDADSNKQMLDVRKCLPGVTLGLRYATANNFMHQKLYPPTHTTYLRRPAVTALRNVIEELKKQNLSIKIL